MERSKQIQVGLLAVLALLLIANLFGGGFKNWFGQSENGQGSSAAAVLGSNNRVDASTNAAAGHGNIPGTNVTTAAAPTGPTTSIKYEETSYDFGVTDEGTVVKHVFKFKNTGSEPLTISNARGSCGCTVPTWPKQPVAPGEFGDISVEFNSKGKPGRQNKQVTVTANTNPTETHLEITGEVRGKDIPAAKGGSH